MDDTLTIIELLSDKVKHGLDVLNASDKYLETMDEVLLEKVSLNYIPLNKFLKEDHNCFNLKIM